MMDTSTLIQCSRLTRGCARRSAKKESSTSFREAYLHLCALQDVRPNRMVALFLEDGILDIQAEKLDNRDWQPVIGALEKPAHNLQFIAIRCSAKNVLKARKQKTSASSLLETDNVLFRIAAALGSTLVSTHHLTCLELQNIQLTLQDLTTLCNGLTSNKTLQHLSLQQSAIGDAGVEVITKVLKNCFSVTSLNLAQCHLTWMSASLLTELIKHQTVLRYSDTWKETLRNRIALLDNMGGIQRITLNGNPNLGDRGINILAEVLCEDLWLKALDLQNCGVQDQGAESLLSALKHNTTLFILDIRLNCINDSNVRLRISQQLSFNVQGHTSQFKWFKLPTNNSNKLIGKSKQSFRKKGIPWRVTARSGSIRHFPTGQLPGIANAFLHTKPTLLSGLSSDDQTESGSIHNGVSGTRQPQPCIPIKSFKKSHSIVSSRRNGQPFHDMLDTIRGEIEEVKELVRKEKDARLLAEKQVIELMEENQRLRQRLASWDDSSLATIEATFVKFNDFMKTLHNVGYGHQLEGNVDPTMNVPSGDSQGVQWKRENINQEIVTNGLQQFNLAEN